MFLTRFSRSWQAFAYCATVTLVAATVLYFTSGTADSSTASASPAVMSPEATFPGAGFGAIPDEGTFTACGNYVNGPRDITFAVTGMTAPLTDVNVNFTIGSPVHTWRGDLRVTLLAPGGAASKVLFSQTGGTTATACGSGNDLAGPYTFIDTAPATPTWWTQASTPTASGSYQATTPGGAATGGTNTPITPSFTGLSTAQINGTWTLRFEDGAGGDTGAVTAGSLNLTGTSGPTPTPTPTPTPSPTPPDALADFDGDGRTDYAVVRIAGGPTSQATWYVSNNATSVPSSRDWGLASDTFIPADFDGDGSDDFAVWRPGAQGTFYVVQSGTNTILVDQFGVTGDDPTVVGDYNNDGKDDVAVYRSGATAGSQSNWYWKSGGTVYNMAWGLNGDFVAPGDYNGDGSNDYAIQRNSGGSSVFYVRYSSGGADVVTTFGPSNAAVANADYDGDKKTDLCVITVDGTLWRWTYRPSLGGADVSTTWGLVASDLPAPGDYNGDGLSDFSVWREAALGEFFTYRPTTAVITQRQWGIAGDTPATLAYTH